MLQADIIGALLVLGFLRFGLPPSDRIQLQDLPTLNLVIFLSYLFISFGVGAFVSLKLLVPVFRWQRRDALLAEDDPAATEHARLRALRMPVYRSVISMTNWVLGAVVFIAASWPVASHAAPVLAVSTAARRHRHLDHRLPAVRAGVAAGGGRRAARRGAGERFTAPASSSGWC